MKLTPQEQEAVKALRENVKFAKACGAFTEDEQADDVLMMRAAVRRLAMQSRPLSLEARSALANFDKF